MAPTGFLGRDEALDLLHRRLWRHGDVVIGLTGAPGVGKSRLAAELAALARRDAVPVLWHDVDSAALTHRCGMHSRMLARAVEGMRRGGPQRGGDAVSRLVSLVGDAPALVVLDGLVHAPLDGALDRLLRECPGLRILYTASRPRRLLAEKLFPVQPLAVPGAGEEPGEAAAYPAVRLVLGPSPTTQLDADVVAVCRLLDGLPLALECATSLLRIYGPATLRRTLSEDPFQLVEAHGLTGSRPLRRRLLETFEELEPDELTVLRLMCVEGVSSVEDVARAWGRGLTECGLLIDGLLACGLIRQESWGRFRPLHLVSALVRKAPMGESTRWPAVMTAPTTIER